MLQVTASLLLLFTLISTHLQAESETLPPLNDDNAPQNFETMWSDFDPNQESLETEVLHEWEEDGVILRIVRFRIGVFKGLKAKMAAIYGFPKLVIESGKRIPGLVQIHGGGQYADHKACLTNAKRGYATVSIAWAGRISAPEYRVGPAEVKLFWENKIDHPNYKLTTDWGAVDGYHAPGRNPGNIFPSAKAAEWTLDKVESPRNSGWFLCALAARRALTFLEQQPEVSPSLLGVYGHSMGGKLTVMTSVDSRVKAAAPSCGGISDRYNSSELFNATIGDDVSLRKVGCPIIFLSPANDFHGRIGDLPAAVKEIASDDWRLTCSPHHNHQDTSEFEVATQLWFDQHLKGDFKFPKTPTTELKLDTSDGVPVLKIAVDRSHPIRSVDVYYTQHGKHPETPEDRLNSMHRFWRHVPPEENAGALLAPLPLASIENPLWVYANVHYELDEPVTGAGYYYGLYTADSFVVSSLVQQVSVDRLVESNVKASIKPTNMIEPFDENWEKEWFTYKPDSWARRTNKLYRRVYRPQETAKLQLQVISAQANDLVIKIDDHAAVTELNANPDWQTVTLEKDDFKNLAGEPLSSWNDAMQLTLSPAERLRPSRGEKLQSKVVGKNWKGPDPQFRNLKWSQD